MGQATFLTPSTDALAFCASILTPRPPRSSPATPLKIWGQVGLPRFLRTPLNPLLGRKSKGS